MRCGRPPDFLKIFIIAMINYKKTAGFLIILFVITGCATYYQQNVKFNDLVISGNLKQAGDYLDGKKKLKEGRNEWLYHANRGWLYWAEGEYKLSNQQFENADQMMVNQGKNFGYEALALVSNPMLKPYQPEDFEKFFVNYYKALNYLGLNQVDEALVECRRINIGLQNLNDKYKEKKNRYSVDAFAHLLMGLSYESNHDYNNAFIAYRNALDAYDSVYAVNFSVNAPEQLKQDLINTASWAGLSEEQYRYEQKFNLKAESLIRDKGEVIFIWQNGFGPVKDEWSINFSQISGEAGWVVFENAEYGLSFPFYVGDDSDKKSKGFADLKFVRVAFPKYIDRRKVFNQADIEVGRYKKQLELVEDVEQIATKTLHDRMLREMGNSLLRLATKQAMEAVTRNENENIGAAVGLLNALTEKADTRNWQTLPSAISYTRLSLAPGEYQLKLNLSGPKGFVKQETIPVLVKKGRSVFTSFHSLESENPTVY